MSSRKFEAFSGDTVRKSRNELMAECLKLGLPVRRDDSYKTLRLFIDLTCEKNSLFIDEDFIPEKRSGEGLYTRKIREFYLKLKSFLLTTKTLRLLWKIFAGNFHNKMVKREKWNKLELFRKWHHCWLFFSGV